MKNRRKVLLLATKFNPGNLFDSDGVARYQYKKDSPSMHIGFDPQNGYSNWPPGLRDWNELSNNVPLAGLGIYIREYSGTPFVYLVVNGIRFDENSFIFDFKTIKKSNTESNKLSSCLPTKALYQTIDTDKILSILSDMGETRVFPSEWKELLATDVIPKIPTWKDFVGKYFLEIENSNLSNDEFEDRVARLLTSLRFEVAQKGHKIHGEYPDGIATFEGDYAIVYDCKNRADFYPVAADLRAISKHLNDERKMRKGKNLFGTFIAKTFAKKDLSKDHFCFSVDVLLNLLYKKLFLGHKFDLAPLKKILDNKPNLTDELIDNEWPNP